MVYKQFVVSWINPESQLQHSLFIISQKWNRFQLALRAVMIGITIIAGNLYISIGSLGCYRRLVDDCILLLSLLSNKVQSFLGSRAVPKGTGGKGGGGARVRHILGVRPVGWQ